MTDLRNHLSRLGLAQYVDQFIEEGFESWDTVLHITESDLDHLKVKLGHRRVLQKEIALARGIPYEQVTATSSPARHGGGDENRSPLGPPADLVHCEGASDPASRGKRKYRRHPKQDESAPERPPSAYVLFSNKIREDLKPLNLSFTEIAKRVGEKWQSLTVEGKNPFEKQAMSMKEKYHKELSIYKSTDEYRAYMEYLADFKAKNGTLSEGKRPKLDTEESTGSSTLTAGSDHHETPSASLGSGRHGLDGVVSGVTQPTAPLRIGTSAPAAVNNASPMSSMASSPAGIRRESSASSARSSMVHRPPLERSGHSGDAAIGSYSSHRSQEGFSRSDSSSSGLERHHSRGHDASASTSHIRASAGTPTLRHFNTASSSGQSSGSGLSNPSTTASSMIAPSTSNNEDETRPHLPPLAGIGVKPSGPPSLADYSLRNNSHTPESITPPSTVPPPLAQPQYSPPVSSSNPSLSSSSGPSPRHRRLPPFLELASFSDPVFEEVRAEAGPAPPRAAFRNMTLQHHHQQSRYQPHSHSDPSITSGDTPTSTQLPHFRDPSFTSSQTGPPTLPSLRGSAMSTQPLLPPPNFPAPHESSYGGSSGGHFDRDRDRDRNRISESDPLALLAEASVRAEKDIDFASRHGGGSRGGT